jgi:hypothetical protein
MTELVMENIDEIRALHNEEKRRAAELARARLSLMGLPLAIETPEEISNLGKKIAKTYKKRREELIQEYGESLPKIVAVALHEYWFACWNSALFFQVSIDDGEFNDNDYTRNLATPEGYADHEGWAYTLANGFADVVPSPDRIACIKELTGHDILDVSTAFRCMALYWFHKASNEVAEGNSESALELIHEAHDALALDFSDRTWDDAWKEAIKNVEENLSSKVRSELASKAGRAAHVETYALKAEIKDFWIRNISPSISNDAAAALLVRQFPMNPRTLSKYVSEFKNTAG